MQASALAMIPRRSQTPRVSIHEMGMVPFFLKMQHAVDVFC